MFCLFIPHTMLFIVLQLLADSEPISKQHVVDQNYIGYLIMSLVN